MNRILGFIVVVAFILHGYFFIRYETIHPCEAAVVRALDNKEPLVVLKDKKILGDAHSDRAVKVAAKAVATKEGYLFCYRFALMGKEEAEPAAAGGDNPYTCTPDVRCPTHYPRIWDYLDRICQGTFDETHVDQLQVLRQKAQINQDDLQFLYSAVSTFHGYRWTSQPHLNKFFYNSKASRWLPVGCLSMIHRFDSRSDIPKRYLDAATNIKALYTQAK